MLLNFLKVITIIFGVLYVFFLSSLIFWLRDVWVQWFNHLAAAYMAFFKVVDKKKK